MISSLNIEYEKYNLSNGLEVILHKNNNAPLVAVNIWYKVGSSFEKRGKTGLAHLFEHMMFQGSENVPKEMHFRHIQEAGGTLNGSTNSDRTNFYEKLPANYLELALWLESDRMGFFLPSLQQEKLDNQKDVVYNERLERYDNQPYGTAWETILKNVYPAEHPYSWPTIGSLEDIKSYDLNDVTNFFNSFYSPSNATLVVAGDVDFEFAKEKIELYFGGIKNNDLSPEFPDFNIPLPEIKNSLVVKEEQVQLERIYLTWVTNKSHSDGDTSMDILSDILTGSKNSRLYKTLSYEKELVNDISAFPYTGKLSGQFVIAATLKPGKSSDEVKAEILKEIEKVIKDGVDDKELMKSKNGIKSGYIYSLQNIDSVADYLNYYNYFLNEPNHFNKDIERYNMVDSSSIKHFSEKYFSKDFFELRIVPSKSGATK